MGHVVIVAYRPKPGRQGALEDLLRRQSSRLRAEGYVTDRRPTLMRAGDGTLIQLLEWTTSTQELRGLPAIGEMRAEFEALADFVPLASLPEFGAHFADLEAVDISGALFPELSP